MGEENKSKPNGWLIGIFAVCAVYALSTLMIDYGNQGRIKVLEGIIEESNHKADSIYARQALFEKAIEKLRGEINDGQMVVREIEREKPKIYNNYINQVSEYRPDSTIERFYVPRATRFDSLLTNGFFFRQ